MKKDNYQSAGTHIRNIGDLPEPPEVIEEHGAFRIVRLAPPYFSGSEIWVVNEKGFFWEPASDVEGARKYLESDEAKAYESDAEPRKLGSMGS